MNYQTPVPTAPPALPRQRKKRRRAAEDRVVRRIPEIRKMAGCISRKAPENHPLHDRKRVARMLEAVWKGAKQATCAAVGQIAPHTLVKWLSDYRRYQEDESRSLCVGEHILLFAEAYYYCRENLARQCNNVIYDAITKDRDVRVALTLAAQKQSAANSVRQAKATAKHGNTTYNIHVERIAHMDPSAVIGLINQQISTLGVGSATALLPQPEVSDAE